MASNTKKTQSIRKQHERSRGKERKRKLRANGTTPAFPIHVDKANEESGSQS